MRGPTKKGIWCPGKKLKSWASAREQREKWIGGSGWGMAWVFATARVFHHHGGAATVISACENSIFLLHTYTTAGRPLKMQGWVMKTWQKCSAGKKSKWMESDSQLDNKGHPTTTLFAPRVSSAAKEAGVGARTGLCLYVCIYTHTQRVYICERRKRETRDKVSLPRKMRRRRKREIRKRRESKTKEAKQSVNNAHYPASLALIQKACSRTRGDEGCEYQSLFVRPGKKSRREGFQKPTQAEEFQAGAENRWFKGFQEWK